jgi:WD40 repeat protein
MPTVAPFDTDGHAVAALFITDTACFAMADGRVHLLGRDGSKLVELHDGLTCAKADQSGRVLLTGGEDGRVCALSADGGVSELGSVGRKWITDVASGPGGVVAFAAGKGVTVLLGGGKIRDLAYPRTAEAIAFAPKGLRIGAARYNGVTMHFPATDGSPTELEWAGAHTGITFSPDGNFLVTTMQENAMHGWKLADGKHMRMSGYPGKVKSMSWAPKGRWLASSGAPAAIVWPFHTKDGPMGKAPLELGTRGNSMVTTVACHPREEMVAIGYDDGMVIAVRFADAREALLRRPGKGPISALGWDSDGKRLAFGSETGDCGIIDISG